MDYFLSSRCLQQPKIVLRNQRKCAVALFEACLPPSGLGLSTSWGSHFCNFCTHALSIFSPPRINWPRGKKGGGTRGGGGRTGEGTPLFPSRGIQPLRGNSNIGEWVVPFRQTTPKRGHLFVFRPVPPRNLRHFCLEKALGIFWQEISQATNWPDMKRRVADAESHPADCALYMCRRGGRSSWSTSSTSNGEG